MATTLPATHRHTHLTGRARLRRRPAVPAAPHLWFAERLLGVLAGLRAITCLAGHVGPDAYDRLWNLAAARTDWRRRARGNRPCVHRCRVVLVTDDALEVTAVVTLTADCYRAIAFRLERPSGAVSRAVSDAGCGTVRHAAQGWRLTAVEAR
jgi:hypothetical protein